MSETKRAAFLAAPDGQIAAAILPSIEEWSEPEPTALQILKTLDQCIYGGAASGFAVRALQTIYEMACQAEGTTHERVAALASWRKEVSEVGKT